MSATVFYDNINQLANLTATFNLNGSPADPTTVSLLVTDPVGVQVTYTVTVGQITRTGTGVYTCAISCAPSTATIDGLWSYVWIGAGAVSDVQPGTWRVLPATVGNLYIGIEELKDRLGITDSADDSALQYAILSASSWINEYCGQHFYRITETRTFMPHDIWRISIDPLVSVTAVNVDRDGSGVFSEPWTQNVDYQLLLGDDRYNINSLGIQRPYKLIQVIQAGRWLPFTWPYTHFDRVQVIGTWGWPSVPPPAAEAARILAALFFKQKDAPFGVAGVSDLGIIHIGSNPWLVELLRPFINPKLKVGI